MIGFDSGDFKRALRIIDHLNLTEKDINKAARKALLPAEKSVRAGIKGFKGKTSKRSISISLLLSRMVRRRMSKKNYPPGARITIDGPDIPMPERDWTATGVAKLFQKDDTGERTTRKTGASRGVFQGKKAGGGDNYIARFSNKVEGAVKSRFEQAAKKLMRDQIKNAKNGR